MHIYQKISHFTEPIVEQKTIGQNRIKKNISKKQNVTERKEKILENDKKNKIYKWGRKKKENEINDKNDDNIMILR